jgi:hypothetical protein
MGSRVPSNMFSVSQTRLISEDEVKSRRWKASRLDTLLCVLVSTGTYVMMIVQ